MSVQEEKKIQRKMNIETIQKLAENSINTRISLKIINVFYVYNKDLTGNIVKEIEKAGFLVVDKIQESEYEGKKYWIIETTKQTIPTKKNLDDMTDECVELANSLSIDYDGWYTEL